MKVLAEYNPTEVSGVYYSASVAELPDPQNKRQCSSLFQAFSDLIINKIKL